MAGPSLALRLCALALAIGSVGAALAQPVGQPARNRPTPEQWQRIFPEHKNLAIRSHRERIAILQKGESCVRAAADSAALRSCWREERRAYQQERRRFKDGMLKLFQSRGIAAPEWTRRGRKGGWVDDGD